MATSERMGDGGNANSRKDGGAAPNWPTEARVSSSSDGWVAISSGIEHRMSEDQARVWNGCRAAMLRAYNAMLATRSQQ